MDFARAGADRLGDAAVPMEAWTESPVGQAMLSAQRIVASANPAFTRMFQVNGVVGRSLEELAIVTGAQGSWRAVLDALAEGTPLHQHRIRAEANGRTISWLCSIVQIETGALITLVDVSEIEREAAAQEQALRALHDELEIRVQQRTAELERTNKDLEGFTYSVSHDLRAPLRAIMGFSKVLVEDFGRDVDAEMKLTLDRINAAASRMSQIIEDLLSFSRLGRKELARRGVNLSEMAESIGADLLRRHPSRHTLIGIDGGMVVNGDPTLLRIALENLLDNAYKFTSKKEHGKVEVRRAGEHTFVVRDNGAGFEPQYSEKLFRPFERLHSASEFPGTGIGLANVRRIIERHGGRVWAEGQPNEGASFYFELL